MLFFFYDAEFIKGKGCEQMGKTTQKRVRRKMAFDLTLLVGLSSVLFWLDLYTSIPDRLTVASEEQNTEIFQNIFPEWLEEAVVADGQGKSDIPSGNLTITGKLSDSKGMDESVTVEKAVSDGEDSYVVQCSLFGAIPIKKVEVDVVERQKIVPCGIPVGIYMKTQGVLIVGTGEVCDMQGEPQNPGGDLVHSGDYILAVNDIPVSEKEEVVQQIGQAAGGEVKLTVLRDSDIIELQAPVIQTGKNEYKAGIWIRDDTQGIGTLTYVTGDGTFGALGHGINDIDTSTLLTLESGNIYDAKVCSIVKGMDGMPGEVGGVIDYQPENILGTITENSEIGIFGTLSSEPETGIEEMEVAYRQEIQTGPATILSEITGERKEYQIEIEKINLNNSDANKSMVIRVTDPELLEITGGIVRGMSGSPILQNGKIVGAVTHVFVKDPARGYGIFIENMLEKTDE